MTQLVGRILRQPEAVKTGIAALDQCYVICHHEKTGNVVDAIKEGLEQEGMGDLAGEIKEEDESGGGFGGSGEGHKIERRDGMRSLEIYLPTVLWTDKSATRPLDYEQDILFHLDWGAFLGHGEGSR